MDARAPADVWFTPALVMEVLSAELTSPLTTPPAGQLKEHTGLAMRFPRFTGRWRNDKGPRDATTTDELVGLYRVALRSPYPGSGRPCAAGVQTWSDIASCAGRSVSLRPVRVMISYAHVDRRWSEAQTNRWRDRVRGFAETLAANGIDPDLDLWHSTDTDIDWTRWGPRRVDASDFTLIVINEAWKERWQGLNRPDEGAGVAVEADTIKGIFHSDQALFQRKHVVVLLDGVSESAIPPELHRLRRVRIAEVSSTGIAELVRMLTGQREYRKPPLGDVPVLLPRPYVSDEGPNGTRAPSTVERLRQTTVAARSAVRPDIIPNIDRLNEFSEKLGTAPAGVPAPLVIVGEGGYGKSVLLGQLYDTLAAGDNDERLTVIVPCSRVPTSAELTDLTSLDRALGDAATDSRDAVPITELVASLTGRCRIRLLIDTFDLVIREDNADDASYLLDRLSNHCDLVITCREREWRDYLENSRVVARSLYRMPRLTADHIRLWAGEYVTSIGLTAEAREPFLDSLVTDPRGRGVLEVCSCPLRLAMACDIYARQGRIPEDLTVTKLYEQYWARRIGQDRHGRRSAVARAQEAAAEAIALDVWRSSRARFVEFVAGETALRDRPAVDNLLSDGVVTNIGGRYGFFHQTYAEFAVARYLVRAGKDEDLARLSAGLRSSSMYWPTAKHLLMMSVSADRYDQLAAAVPVDTVEGVRTQFLGAFNRGSADLVRAVANRVHGVSASLLIRCIGVLESSPRPCLPASLDVVIRCATDADASTMSRVGMTAAPLILSCSEEDRARELARVVDAITARADELGHEATSSVMHRLVLQTVRNQPEPDLLRVLVDRYAALPEAARAEVVSLAAERTDDPELDLALLVAALRLPCPAGAADHATTVLRRAWPNQTFRRSVGWDRWPDMFEADLPTRWDSCQVRLIADLCRDTGIAQELLHTAMEPTVTARDRYTNAVKFLADDEPQLVWQAYLRLEGTLDPAALGTLCSVLNHAGHLAPVNVRLSLIELLDRHAHLDRRRVYPTTIKLCGDDIDLLRARAAALAQEANQRPGAPALERTVLLSTLDTFLNVLDSTAIAAIEPELRALCPSDDPRDRTRRARLEGALTPVSVDAQAWIEHELNAGTSANVVSAAALATVDALPNWPAAELTTQGIPWLFRLLRSPHSNAVRVIATGLAELAATTELAREHGPPVLDRLLASIAKNDDAQVQGALLDLLVAIQRGPGLDRPVVANIVDRYFTSVTDAIEAGPDPAERQQIPALLAHFTRSFTALALHHLDEHEVEVWVNRILTTLDVGAVASRSKRHLASMLTAVVSRYPLIVPKLEQLWALTSDANKHSIAECFAFVESGSMGLRSLALARRPDCPSDVANYIHSKFGG